MLVETSTNLHHAQESPDQHQNLAGACAWQRRRYLRSPTDDNVDRSEMEQKKAKETMCITRRIARRVAISETTAPMQKANVKPKVCHSCLMATADTTRSSRNHTC